MTMIVYSDTRPVRADDLLPLKQGKQLSEKHEKFIAEMIAHGNRVDAYKAVYPDGNDRVATVGASRLMSHPIIKARVIEGRLKIYDVANEAIKIHYKEKCSGIAEKRELLAKILRQEVSMETEVITEGNKKVTKVKSDLKQLLKAMEMDNKLENDKVTFVNI